MPSAGVLSKLRHYLERAGVTRADLFGCSMRPSRSRARERNCKRTWTAFLRSHWETLYACDFFAVEVLGAFGAVRYMVFFIMQAKTRAVQFAGIRTALDGDWMMQVGRNLLDPEDGFPRHAISMIAIPCSPMRGLPS
jgi:putative transposase